MARLRTWRAAGRIALGIMLAPAASAGIFYDFEWSDGGSRSATGTLELDDAVGVGEGFGLDDVLFFSLELFDGVASLGSASYPPEVYDPPFDQIVGTRLASSLAIDEFTVGEPAAFGCNNFICLSGEILFPGAPGGELDFGSQEAAQMSFVFTEVPEPGAAASAVSAGLALGLLAGLRTRG